MKEAAFSIIFKGLSIKRKMQFFLESESPTLRFIIRFNIIRVSDLFEMLDIKELRIFL